MERLKLDYYFAEETEDRVIEIIENAQEYLDKHYPSHTNENLERIAQELSEYMCEDSDFFSYPFRNDGRAKWVHVIEDEMNSSMEA